MLRNPLRLPNRVVVAVVVVEAGASRGHAVNLYLNLNESIIRESKAQ